MTNAEKFVEVFGTDIKRQYVTKSWWDQEFVPQKTGHWIEHDIKDTCSWLTCSVCGYEWINVKENFCPNCGMRMVESESKYEG